MDFRSLPVEIIYNIADYLDVDSVINLSGLNHKYLTSDEYWNSRLTRDYGCKCRDSLKPISHYRLHSFKGEHFYTSVAKSGDLDLILHLLSGGNVSAFIMYYIGSFSDINIVMAILDRYGEDDFWMYARQGAAKSGRLDLMKRLTNPAFKNRDNWRFVMHDAIINNQPKIVKYLFDIGVADNRHSSYYRLLELTIDRDQPEILEILINGLKPDVEILKMALKYAKIRGYHDMIHILNKALTRRYILYGVGSVIAIIVAILLALI